MPLTAGNVFAEARTLEEIITTAQENTVKPSGIGPRKRLGMHRETLCGMSVEFFR